MVKAAAGQEAVITRRQVLRGALVAGGGLLVAGADQPEHLMVAASTQPVNPEIVGHFVRLRRVLADEDNLLGSRHLIPLVADRMKVIHWLRTKAIAGLRRQLLQVEAQYAEFTAWLYQNIGDLPAALWWADRAMEYAQEADDHLFISHVFGRKAQIAQEAGQAQRTIDLAGAAVRNSGHLTKRVHAFAILQQAHGHALAGESVQCETRLDDVARLMSSTDEGDPGIHMDLGQFCTESYVTARAATCWLQLGQPRRAVQIFESSLRAWPAGFRRDRGLFLSQAARAQVANDEPEGACVAATEALHIAVDTGCARIVGELRQLELEMTGWRHVPAVAEFREALSELPPTGSG